ncbi:MAG: hypothetical protein M1827_005995 [Pycnora praestabilis]|nr:MAG: hypothetical protein M1827_005995 [Pycnora praestabilis]
MSTALPSPSSPPPSPSSTPPSTTPTSNTRKAHKAHTKSLRRSARQNSPSFIAASSKACSLCQRPSDVLVRCQIDEGAEWKMVCVGGGGCWKKVSGGVVDGKWEGFEGGKRWYRYGGIWKNRRADVTGKKPKAKGKGKGKGGGKELAKTEGGKKEGG